MKRLRSKKGPQVSAGSMADIAFLLLIFFLVSTNLIQDKGLMLQLPPDVTAIDTPIKERNLFKVLINSKNEYLVEGDIRSDLTGLVEEVKLFVQNPSSDPSLAESPEKAIISIKTQRGAHYASFINALDLIKESYYQMYGEQVGLSSEEYRRLNHKNLKEYNLYLKGKKNLPMNISIAEPDKIKSI